MDHFTHNIYVCGSSFLHPCESTQAEGRIFVFPRGPAAAEATSLSSVSPFTKLNVCLTFLYMFVSFHHKINDSCPPGHKHFTSHSHCQLQCVSLSFSLFLQCSLAFILTTTIRSFSFLFFIKVSRLHFWGENRQPQYFQLVLRFAMPCG